MRNFHPAFLTRFLWALIASLWLFSRQHGIPSQEAPTLVKHISKQDLKLREVNMKRAGVLGKVYDPGEVIVQQGEVGDAMYVIQEGQVEVIVARDGKSVQLAVRGEGELIGEMAIFERQTRMATVRALGYARVLTVDRKTLLRRIHEDPSLGYHLIQAMSHRIRDLSAEVLRLKGDQPESGEQEMMSH